VAQEGSALKLETVVLLNLIENDDYVRKCLPYLREEYFHGKAEKLLFKLIGKYLAKYNTLPSKEALQIELSNTDNLSQELFQSTKSTIDGLRSEKSFDLDWIIDKTEHFCQERAIHIALLSSIDIAENKPDTKGSIPEILTKALSVSFDTNIGHNLLEDWEARWHHYTSVEVRKPFSLQMFNKISGGGLPDKTLTVALAGTGVGKSRWMCSEAAHDLQSGRNVLYITLEMADWRIAERIDANILDTPIAELARIEKDEYQRRINLVKTIGKLIIKEYPTTSASSLNFKHLLNELKLKKHFKPDVMYVDYINICASSRLRRGMSSSYEYIKAIAEELRGLAVECSIPIITATQTNRAGFSSSDPGLEDTAESFGLPATTDLMFALISTDELNELDQQMVKQLKNRLGDPTHDTRFVIGIDKPKMRYYDVDQEAQEDVLDGPVADQTPMGGRSEIDRAKFNGFF